MKWFSEKKHSAIMHKNYKLSSLMLQMDGLKDGRVDLVFLSKLFLEKKKQQHIKWLAHGEKSFFLRTILHIHCLHWNSRGSTKDQHFTCDEVSCAGMGQVSKEAIQTCFQCAGIYLETQADAAENNGDPFK